jgi:DNA-binding MarR family transcriptional regulator
MGHTLAVGASGTPARTRKRRAENDASGRRRDATASNVPNDEEVTEAIILASRAMVAVAVRSLAGSPDNITLPQFRTLVVLHYGGTRRLADLADALSVSPSTATRMCDRLVRKGLVSRARDDLDRREVNLAITASGRKVVNDVIDRRKNEVSNLLGAIPEALRAQLVSSLALLAKAAGEAPQLHWGPGWSF